MANWKRPTLNRRIKLEIPAETQGGKGVRMVRSAAAGDRLCQFQVETPVNLTQRQQVLLQASNASLEQDSLQQRPRPSSWLDRVKKSFKNVKFSPNLPIK